MQAKYVLALTLVFATAAVASTALVSAPVVGDEATDAIGTPREVERFESDFDYTVEWAFGTGAMYAVGVGCVQDTLIWVSAARTPTVNKFYIYDARDHNGVAIDSFNQFNTNSWGTRDLAYDPVEDVVWGGTDASKLDKIDATLHTQIANYTVSGSPVPTTIRALADDGDSLYSGNFTSNPIVKFSKTGTNSHATGGVPPYAVYGLAIDDTRGKMYATTADYSYMIIEYNFPAMTVADSVYISEVEIFGGCDMLNGATDDDEFLVVLAQTAVDSVFCFRLSGGGTTTDVGVSGILAPAGNIMPGAVTPKAQIKNFGSDPQSNIPVYCEIDSAGTNIYVDMQTYAGPLAPGSTAEVEFTDWTAVNGMYDVTMYTDLSGDENPANDTMTGTVSVAAAVWEVIPAPSTVPDKIVHATVYDPGTDMVYQIGGNPAGATGTYDGICRCYDPGSQTWTTKAPMPTPLGWCGYGLVDDKIYMISGHNNAGGFVGTTQEFDIAGNSWSTKTARPGTAVAAPLSATWNDTLIYIMGGLATAAETRVDIYDPANDAWMTGTALPLGAYMGSATCIGDTIYIAQAYNTACWPNFYKGAIDPANPGTINWIQGPAMPTPVFNGATVPLGDKVAWMGGFANATTATDEVWTYDLMTGAITQFTPDYPIANTRCTFGASRATTDGWEIYGMAGDMNGDWAQPNQTYVKIALGVTGTSENPGRMPGFVLGSVTPSMVRDHARISYTLNRTASVELGIYDAAGKLVRTLVSGIVEPGDRSVTWDRTGRNGDRVARGTYFYRLTVDGESVGGKAIVVE